MKYTYTVLIFIISILLNCKSTYQIVKPEMSERKSKSYLIDKNDTIILDSLQLIINDSIITKIKNYNSKIEAINYFKKSNTEVKITFYKENSKLNLIRVKEESNEYDDTDKYIDYIIDNNKIKDFHLYYGHQLGFPFDPNKSYSDQFGLNKYLNDDFYRKFSLEIYNKLHHK